MKILVVEDTPASRIVMKAMLTRLKCDVVLAESAREGFERIGDGIDLVVTDIQMPEHTGIDLYKWIRAAPQFSSMPVAAYTADARPERTEQLMGLGFLDVLVKPVTLERLQQFLESLGASRG